MKLIGLFIIIAIGITAWALFGPDQQQNLLAVKEAIGIDAGNPYAAKLRKLGEKQQAITEELEGGSSSLNGARLTDGLIATQGEIMSEFNSVIKGLRKEGGEEAIILDIEDSGIISAMRVIQKQLKDGKLSAAADRSGHCAGQMKAWANELDGSD